MRSVTLAIAAIVAGYVGPAAAEDICQLPQVDAFLQKCPTNDPAIGQIKADFAITKDGIPVTVNPGDCTEPVPSMPIAQYTDALSLLQALRAVYYLDRDRCGHLPWTPLSLYDWLKSQVAGFNFNSATTSDFCCLDSGGRHYVQLRVNDDSNREYHRKWEGIAEWIALLMHEARHAGNMYLHVSCCPAGPAACDNQYDEANLSAYGIQYWLEKAWLDGTLHTGYTCLSPTRTTDIKTWLRGAANARQGNFCTNPPPVLTDANNPPPACNQDCATEAACVAPAWGVPPNGGPPVWWGTSPPQPAYHNRLDDPRWSGASKVTYSDGTGEKAEFRALHSSGYLYLSWRAFVAPAATPDQNSLYFGYRAAGGGDVIVSIALNALTPATASATQFTLKAFNRQADGTLGAAVTPPAEVSATTRVWVDPTGAGSWAVQLQLQISALAQTCGRAQFWYELLTGTPTMPVASFTWPRSGADVQGSPPVFPNPQTWNWLRPSTGPSDPHCAVGGVSLEYTNIGTTNTPASNILYRAVAPFPANTLFARPTNHTGSTIPAGAITATFRLANWGSVPGDWEQGVPVDQLWAPIPGGSNVLTTGSIADGTTADATSESRFNWTVQNPDLSQFVSGVRRQHQCMLVELKSTSSPGLKFVNSSVYRNMDVVSASRFERDALLSIKGLAPAAGGSRDLYVYIETRDMPEHVSPGQIPEPTPTRLPPTPSSSSPDQDDQVPAGRDNHIPMVEANRAAADGSERVSEQPGAAVQQTPTYRVHIYYDTGKVLSVGGVVRPVLHHQTSFGYEVTHEGALDGWRHQFKGAGVVELAPDWYRVSVPNDGAVSVTTTIEALEPGFSRFWLWLMLLLLLALVAAVVYALRSP